MSKKKSTRKQTRKSPPPSKKVKKKKYDPSVWLDRPQVASDLDPFYKKVFTGLSVVILLITIFMAIGSGINGDDEFQNDYSTKLVNYYSTMGADTSALFIQKGNMPK